MTTKVVNIKDEVCDVYIGRGSIWGSPFSHRMGTKADVVVPTRQEAIRRYREWILTQPKLLNKLYTLKGQLLGCHCKPQSCHGDILAELSELSITEQEWPYTEPVQITVRSFDEAREFFLINSNRFSSYFCTGVWNDKELVLSSVADADAFFTPRPCEGCAGCIKPCGKEEEKK